MKLLDVNIVLAAHRQDHPHHALVRPWFDEILASDERFAVPDVVWLSLVRIATHRRVFTVPSDLDSVRAFIDAVRDQPNHVTLVPSPQHLDWFTQLCKLADATGDLAPDAYLAALAIENGSTLVSMDRDFARFPGLQWETPRAQPPQPGRT